MSKALIMNLETHVGNQVETDDYDRALAIQAEFIPDSVELRDLLEMPFEVAIKYKPAAYKFIEIYNRNAAEIERFQEAAEIAALHSALSDFVDAASKRR